MKRELAVDFLLFSVIGASIVDDKDTLLDRGIARAYRDASSRVGYFGDLQIEENKEAFEGACGVLKDKIEQATFSNQESFNKWHEKICAGIKPGGSDQTCYGKAQKWLNMTLKYLAVTYAVLLLFGKTSHPFVEFYEKKLANAERFFHIPIDSYVCDALCWSGLLDDNEEGANSLKESIPVKKESKPLPKQPSKAASPYDSYIKSWSQWNQDEYKNCASQLKEQQLDLNWETRAWIDVARCRALKDPEDRRGRRNTFKN